MVTANGNYLTKHSAGLYSTEPTKGRWRCQDPKKLQAELDAGPKRRVNTRPAGTGTIETYCVAYGRDTPEKAYVIGRLDSSGDRFVAMRDNDATLLADMLTKEQLGRRISVKEKAAATSSQRCEDRCRIDGPLASNVSYKIHSPRWSNCARRRRLPSGSAVFVIGKREPVFRFAWIG